MVGSLDTIPTGVLVATIVAAEIVDGLLGIEIDEKLSDTLALEQWCFC